MKKSKLTLILLLCVLTVSAKNLTIKNPSCDFKTTGIYEITKIELGKKETRVTVCTKFIPNWWITFSKKTYIQNSEGGERIIATGIEGCNFDQQVFMPEDGDSTFVVIFPPLDKSIKKIDFGSEDEGDKPILYGVSLTPVKAGTVLNNKIPNDVETWLTNQVSLSKRKYSNLLNQTDFFCKDTARIVGYIKGYDIRSGLSTGIVYISNELTREDNPIVVQIYPDGRFEADLPVNYPKHSYIYFKSQSHNIIPFYIEPGNTIGIVLDWNDFLQADRQRNIRYSFQKISFLGPLAEINRQIMSVKLKEPDYQNLENLVKTLYPKSFLDSQAAVLEENLEIIRKAQQTNQFSPEAITILKSEALTNNAAFHFDFLDRREYSLRSDTTNQILKAPVPSNFYDFLKKMPLSENSLLVSSNFGTFINRFEYCDPFRQSEKSISITTKPSKSFFEYLTEEGVKFTEDEKKLISWQESLKTGTAIDTQSENFKLMIEKLKVFYEKHNKDFPGYEKKYLSNAKAISKDNYQLKKWIRCDSILENELGLKPNLVYEICKTRSLPFVLKTMTKDDARNFITTLDNGITNPFLLQENERIFNKTFPAVDKVAYPLPAGKATDIFRKIIDPFKGKILFVDFWATTCAPCVSGIKSMKPTREKYKDNKDFEFIFITSYGGSPQTAYDNFVKDQELKNTFRISENEHNYLRQLFNFNGIPHYVAIDADGNVINDDFHMYNFEYELTNILKNKKNQ
jgi:thiol-disulfide isomerase/thioredoxin